MAKHRKEEPDYADLDERLSYIRVYPDEQATLMEARNIIRELAGEAPLRVRAPEGRVELHYELSDVVSSTAYVDPQDLELDVIPGVDKYYTNIRVELEKRGDNYYALSHTIGGKHPWV